MSRVDHFRDPEAPAPNSIVIAVSTFVLDDAGRLLMIRRTDNDLYALPGGRHELGETMTETAVRETREETGYDVAVTSLVGIYSDPEHVMAYDDGEVRQEFSICFRAELTGGQARTSSESSEVVWVDLDHLDDIEVHPSIRLRIEHARTEDPAPYYT
ncbi:NUDIX hydrolase [Actinomycetospora cinnamomea]|uniref:ADP-ribose pyrophosphatase YjhB (NUDIX family) n=1 Tax=Actinomycetospora cinnamomea TaxID=663609 RepID=A0A2U1FAP5_9PSEU|nr:NUDIX domain-containing protein [Actinomycetospora cinnamomea]PVZ09040.1 ADP-ribose pyrophosphatase YjhB (NUDIX family) [Actinomycetospora cinnamomea]